MTVHYTPEGYHAITPYLIVRDAAKAIEFYSRVFHATELMRIDAAEGKIGHAELQIGDSRVMLADENPEEHAFAPQSPGSAGVGFCLYVANADQIVQQAVEAGARIRRPLQDQFYGDRSATLEDPFGHLWTVSTHIEDVSPEEMERRIAAMQS